VIFFKQSMWSHGDDFFNGGMFPFIDIDAAAACRADYRRREILAEVPDDVKIIPGHGPSGTGRPEEFITVLKENFSRS